MMRILGLVWLILLSTAIFGQAQADLTKVVETEKAFAKLAEEKGTKAAFLANLSNDAVLFLPDQVNAKEYWLNRTESKALLSWAPNFADVSANGLLGYTTGNWEFRPNGKGDTPTAYGEFITVWQRQPDGPYKFVVDIGVGHEKRDVFSTDWTTTKRTLKDTNDKKLSAADTASSFYGLLKRDGAKAAYKAYASDEIRLYREGKFPFVGRRDALKAVGREKSKLAMSRRASFFGSADLSYVVSTYSLTDGDKVVEKGNYLQIWKLEKGGWRIVLDILKPVP